MTIFLQKREAHETSKKKHVILLGPSLLVQFFNYISHPPQAARCQFYFICALQKALTVGEEREGIEQGRFPSSGSNSFTGTRRRRRRRRSRRVNKKKKMGSKGEKSNFSQACRLLSQYLREKGSLSGLGIDMPALSAPFNQQGKGQSRSRATMNLLPGADVPGEEQAEIVGEIQSSPKSMDLFPQHSGFGPGALPQEEAPEKPDLEQIEKNQLTIFYGGKVLVFDNFPADKAKNLMQMANKEGIAAQNFSLSTNPHSSSAAGADGAAKPDPNLAPETTVRSTPPPPPRPENLSKASADMPIARRNSLHRFLEKRKDRINTKAPYQVNGSASEAAPSNEAKPESSHSWLNLGRHTQVSQPEQSPESSK